MAISQQALARLASRTRLAGVRGVIRGLAKF
jgi:hypothetical protein